MSDQEYIGKFLNFSKIIANDPEEIAKLNQVMHSSTKERNTLTLHEFSKYEPIFKFNSRDILGDDAYDELCADYFNRITPYHPVHVVDDEGTIVLTLPAVFNPVNSVSDLGTDGCNAIDAFINAHGASDEFNIKKRTYTEYLGKVFDAAQNQDKRMEKIEETTKHLKEFNKIQSGSDTSPEIVDYTPEEISDLGEGITDEVEYL